MKLLCIGGGVASVFCAIKTKLEHPTYDVTILESDKRILKRILVSGNGRSNFFNSSFISNVNSSCFSSSKYNCFFSLKDALNLLAFLNKELHFKFFTDDSNRMYPFANTSESLYNVLINKIKQLNIDVITECKVTKIDYSKHLIKTSTKDYSFDKLYLGIGGISYDRNKKDYNDLLSSLDLKLDKQSPALCPLVVKEKIPSFLVGTRIKGTVSLLKDNKEIYQEEGELLFKKDGLSGILIFNCSFFIDDEHNNRYTIRFNPFIHDNEDIMFNSINVDELNGLLSSNVIKYLINDNKNMMIKKEISYEYILQKFAFNVAKKYDYKDSQITLGGISLDEINSNFSLKKYPLIYVGGEEISLHGICGGFNIGLAMLEGLKVSIDE